jgi:hypothetical protein
MRELLEVERLARLILDELIPTYIGGCDATIEESSDCHADVTGEETCPKCGTAVPFKRRCENTVRFDGYCENTVSIDFDDDQALLRDLRLALVALDLARSRESFGEEAVSGTTAVAKTEAA